ncbi:DUF952 domain-containing protein [Cyanobium sp. FGCU-52]|nr:DUF952 domain-containing protein [Cyanobium sp. FGCU52]
MAGLPVLYSFRRCPYAIRARQGLRAAGFEPGVSLELREVDLACRPPELLAASAKATVPVLVLPSGDVIDESLAILHWALEQRDPQGWWAGWRADQRATGASLIEANDGPFKHHLDRWRYPERFEVAEPARHRAAALDILRDWNQRLEAGGWLLGSRPALVDWALLPFVRQFRLSDPDGFDAEPALAALRAWLARFLESPELAAVMAPPWGPQRSWPSPHWLYHLALAEDWNRARTQELYPWSTRGRRQADVGFVHLCRAHQIASTWQRFYADAGPVRLLTLDPAALTAAGLELREESAPGSGELFPHLYGGPLPLAAVRHHASYRPHEPAGAVA